MLAAAIETAGSGQHARLPPSKINRKARRALKHNTNANPNGDVSDSASGDVSRRDSANSPVDRPSVVDSEVTISASPVDDGAHPVSKNPYVEVINKKLRYLKKKLLKLEKYEQSAKRDLNADQLQALEKKAEIAYAFKELEESAKLLVAVGAEESKAIRAKDIATDKDVKSKIELAIEEEKNASAASQKEILQLFYVLNVLLSNLANTNVALSENQYNALFYFRAFVTGVGIEHIETAPGFSVEQAEEYLKNYKERSSITFFQDVTFRGLAEAVEIILNPRPQPKFGFESDETPAEIQHAPSFFSPSEINEESAHPHEDAQAPQAAPSFGTISFFTPSEVLDLQDSTPAEAPVEEPAHPVEQETHAPVESEHSEEEHAVVAPALVKIPIHHDQHEEQPLIDTSAQPAAPAPVEEASTQVTAPEPQPQQQVDAHPGQQRPHRGRGRGGYRGNRGRGGAYNNNNAQQGQGQYHGNGNNNNGYQNGYQRNSNYRGRGRGGGQQGGQQPGGQRQAPGPQQQQQ
ncbi:uncharacterized protein EV422DRAFT_107845 [Fimicolochytrium jonesii]|uniref:uncharacterized protein n=1 Tax=Fimicolochytrium jonesii TaxID=1396493 RepID=UPI0022FE4CB6|nr:uncharacterized protein EV422DRAFT_107845 [Fimicolochytrium jonesii]KAI8819325.1 hypothetical protein EV422DRAFT_107845 [Fimicolochytrium jonesii]